MKRLISVILTVFISAMATLTLASCGGSSSYGTHHVEMTIENHGTVKIELYGDKAPITVNNFINLAKSGYYDGTKIIRIQPGFVVQGGRGAGTASIKGEFSSNGVDTGLKHERGTLSMARSTSPDSASDQFFICLDSDTASQLDGNYAAFGKITDGMDIIDSMASGLTVNDVTNDYYGLVMGFLKESSYITITSARVID